VLAERLLGHVVERERLLHHRLEALEASLVAEALTILHHPDQGFVETVDTRRWARIRGAQDDRTDRERTDHHDTASPTRHRHRRHLPRRRGSGLPIAGRRTVAHGAGATERVSTNRRCLDQAARDAASARTPG